MIKWHCYDCGVTKVSPAWRWIADAKLHEDYHADESGKPADIRSIEDGEA